MDVRRFDALARALGSAGNRRQVLKGLLGIGGLTAATSLNGAEAARRPIPTPRPVSCPGEQIWDGDACMCPDGKVTCGPACCAPGVSECCDNACCFGTCYGEELCCPTGMRVCGGECVGWECCANSDCPGQSICNVETHTCQCLPDCTGKTCGDDGCGGRCGTCGELATCVDGACVCMEGAIFCEEQCRDWTCCSADDCPDNSSCDPESHTCICVPDCTGKTCGDDGCGGSCGTCPESQACVDGACVCASGFLCEDGACHSCCAAADCAVAFGGDAECWKCLQGSCGYFSGFCSGGVCGVSSKEVIGHCVECGVGWPPSSNASSDSCSEAVPCCTGYACDFSYGAQGLCRPVA
jgi:hypothetical protein